MYVLCVSSETDFSRFQVDQFYSTLPSQEVPRLGTKGEQIRSERLVRQLPRQDLALTACKFIEADHKSGYEVIVI